MTTTTQNEDPYFKMSERLKAIRRRSKSSDDYVSQEDVAFLLTLIADIDRQGDETESLTHTERANPQFWMPGKSENQYITFQKRYEVTLIALEEENQSLKREVTQANKAMDEITGIIYGVAGPHATTAQQMADDNRKGKNGERRQAWQIAMDKKEMP